MEAAVVPFPIPEITPPETKMYFVFVVELLGCTIYHNKNETVASTPKIVYDSSASTTRELEKEIESLRLEMEKIKERNKRVETDKAWETSKTRNLFIALSAFTLIYIVMRQVNADHPLENALLGSIAYYLSTQSYGILRSWWLKRKK